MTSPSTASSPDRHRTTPDTPAGWFGSASEAAPSVRRRAVVLVIGESTRVRQELRAPLDGIDGVRVIEAWNASAALDLSRERVLHVIIADAPCAEIGRTLPWLPVVVIADADDGRVRAGSRCRVVRRPIDATALRAVLAELLRH